MLNLNEILKNQSTLDVEHVIAFDSRSRFAHFDIYKDDVILRPAVFKGARKIQVIDLPVMPNNVFVRVFGDRSTMEVVKNTDLFPHDRLTWRGFWKIMIERYLECMG